jgi:hypothetical protein
MPWTTSFIAALLRDTPVIRFLFVGAGAAWDALLLEAVQQHLDNVMFVPAQSQRLPVQPRQGKIYATRSPF